MARVSPPWMGWGQVSELSKEEWQGCNTDPRCPCRSCLIQKPLPSPHPPPPPPDKTWSTYTADQGGFHLTKQQNMQWRLSAPTGDACLATFSTAQECSRHVNQNNVHRYVFVLWNSSFPMYLPTPRKYLLPLNPLSRGMSNDLPWRAGVGGMDIFWNHTIWWTTIVLHEVSSNSLPNSV